MPLAVLQELGGWESSEMVRRYAHLGQDHISTFADQLSLDSDEFAVSGTKLAQAANLE
jgi:beta-glucosidase/6-phospho-beta-glucosidase/beta-galactosidase